MSLNKNIPKQSLTMYSSQIISNPETKLKQNGFQTFRSLQSKKDEQAQSLKQDSEIKTTVKRQLELIDTIRHRGWLRETDFPRMEDKNMQNLIKLIRRQKMSQQGKSSCFVKSRLANINKTCLKNFDNLKMMASSFLDNADCRDRSLKQRSNSTEFADQPMRVKLFKKMSMFNKNQNLEKLPQHKATLQLREAGLLQGKLMKKYSKMDFINGNLNDQGEPIHKQSKYIVNQQQINTQKRKLCRLQSINGRGEILSKDDDIRRRRRCIRQMNLIDKSLENRDRQPVFLLQI